MVRGGLVAATLQVKPEEIRRFCQTAPTRLLRVEPGSLGGTRQCQARWRRAGVASASRGNHPACTSEARKVEETAFAREGRALRFFRDGSSPNGRDANLPFARVSAAWKHSVPIRRRRRWQGIGSAALASGGADASVLVLKFAALKNRRMPSRISGLSHRKCSF